ncbi:MAG: tetratricopeptide repeat protein [Rhodospirillaceae bacterium]
MRESVSAGGGVRRPGTFIEKSKGLIDELNAFHTRKVLMPTDFSKITRCISYYDSMIVFDRGTRGDMHRVITGRACEEASACQYLSIIDGEDVQQYFNRLVSIVRRGEVNLTDIITFADNISSARPDAAAFIINDWISCSLSAIKHLAHYKLGNYYLMAGNSSAARKAFQDAIGLRPDFKCAHKALADLK